jgi:glycosyltransferase involved in cell wall biosynthesis
LHSISIVIPAYNEERRLPASLDAVLEYVRQKRPGFHEVVVVDDGSTDGTAACVREYAATHETVRLVRNPGNRGKGYSVRHGMLEAKGEWRLFTDADLSAPIEELDKLTDAVQREQAEIAIGSRALDRSLIGVHQPVAREYAGRAFNTVMRLITGLPFADTQCGFKLYHAPAAERIFPLQRLDGFSFDVEDLVIARTLGIRVVEVPVRWNNVEGTKVSLAQGLRSFVDPIRIRAYEMHGRYEETASPGPHH